ncbi:LysR family transcriptional regulator [Sulfitobacter aestuariivivens]|uniref:LysR family transcriptional regulator n=1 Tax=Sulfitobacter aestuariivivens TaxID=2766981 RepID=UPI0036164D23
MTWFRAFEAAARHLSFTVAAEELGFTQSAISQHVRSLEDRLGKQLFVRRHRALQLTDAGRLLLPDVAAAMAQLGRATARFQPTVSKRKLVVATSASIAQWIIAPRLASFTARHPDIAVQIATTIWPDDFSTTTADIEIRFGSADVVGHGARLLEPSFLHMVAAPEIATRLGADCGLADLEGLALIQPVGLTQNWAALGKANAKPIALEAGLFVDTHGLSVDLAISGAGVALAHCQVSRAAILAGQLAVLRLPPLAADEGYYLALLPSVDTDARDAFAEWLQAEITALHHMG